MTIDFANFTPWASLLGGLTIGLAAAIYLLANGRVAGIAGIVASPLRAMLAGLLAPPKLSCASAVATPPMPLGLSPAVRKVAVGGGGLKGNCAARKANQDRGELAVLGFHVTPCQ